jgi:hypothetical protein
MTFDQASAAAQLAAQEKFGVDWVHRGETYRGTFNQADIATDLGPGGFAETAGATIIADLAQFPTVGDRPTSGDTLTCQTLTWRVVHVRTDTVALEISLISTKQ